MGAGDVDGIDRLAASIRTWMDTGLIQCTETDPEDPAFAFVLDWSNDALILKSRFCRTSASESAICSRCSKLACSRSFAKEVIRWSTRIHLVDCCKLICMGSAEEKRHAKDELLRGDFYMTAEGRAEVDAFLEQKDDVAAVCYVMPAIIRQDSLKLLLACSVANPRTSKTLPWGADRGSACWRASRGIDRQVA